MTTLVVAAGGGGDALGALVLRRVVQLGERPLIATYAWERLRIDPVPGPRGVEGFTGLGDVGGRPMEVVNHTETLPPGRSSLPRLAAQTSARFFVLDAGGGAVGLADQVQHLTRCLHADRVIVVDIGGDVLARGDEPELRSPLADALTLAASAGLDLPVHVVVAGLGLDGELPALLVRERLEAWGAERLADVDDAPVEDLGVVVTWHPSEASVALHAVARGITGTVTSRRGGEPLRLDAVAREVWRLPLARALAESPPAAAVAGTRSCDEADRALGRLGVSELTYEREKARRLADHREGAPGRVGTAAIHRALAEYLASAARPASTFVTTRYLAEAVDVAPGSMSDLLDVLAPFAPAAIAGLWHVATLAAMLAGGPETQTGRRPQSLTPPQGPPAPRIAR